MFLQEGKELQNRYCFFITILLGIEKSNGGTENGDLFFNIMVALVGTSVIWLAIYFKSDLFPFSKYLRLRLETMPSNVNSLVSISEHHFVTFN